MEKLTQLYPWCWSCCCCISTAAVPPGMRGLRARDDGASRHQGLSREEKQETPGAEAGGSYNFSIKLM